MNTIDSLIYDLYRNNYPPKPGEGRLLTIQELRNKLKQIILGMTDEELSKSQLADIGNSLSNSDLIKFLREKLAENGIGNTFAIRKRAEELNYLCDTTYRGRGGSKKKVTKRKVTKRKVTKRKVTKRKTSKVKRKTSKVKRKTSKVKRKTSRVKRKVTKRKTSRRKR